MIFFNTSLNKSENNFYKKRFIKQYLSVNKIFICHTNIPEREKRKKFFSERERNKKQFLTLK